MSDIFLRVYAAVHSLSREYECFVPINNIRYIYIMYEYIIKRRIRCAIACVELEIKKKFVFQYTQHKDIPVHILLLLLYYCVLLCSHSPVGRAEYNRPLENRESHVRRRRLLPSFVVAISVNNPSRLLCCR